MSATGIAYLGSFFPRTLATGADSADAMFNV